MMTAVAGTVMIACGAFWLSFTALADLAQRSGIDAGQAWAWPLIVDGIIIVASVAVVALAGTRTAWYPWLLLICGAGLSVTANGVHAVLASDADVPAMLAASVAAVPPLVLLAITHLTVILTRHQPGEEHDVELRAETAAPETRAVPLAAHTPALQAPKVDTGPEPVTEALPVPEPAEPSRRDGREMAEALRADGWSNKKIARHLDVHPSTVGRWLPHPSPHQKTEPDAELVAAAEVEQVTAATADPRDEEEPK